jgi:cyclopropane fatty-acyl-phospholipid synthase-like methyltransferase
LNFPKSQKYDKQFISDNLMGPNALKMVEELTLNLDLQPGMRVLDLGCGKGLTSIFLAKEFGVQVFATDLWITATENYGRFKQVGLDKQIIPIHADANALPYADEYFDAVISVDAYYYFGKNETFMDEKLAPLIKPDGIIALAFPGFKKDIHEHLPPEFLLSWTAEDLETFHSCEWWSNLFSKSKKIRLDKIGELSCHDESWADWLATDNPYAVKDRPSMAAGTGKYMNLISVLATRKS